MVYPESVPKAGLQGKVFIGFVVRKDGRISDVEILKGADPALNAEALRLVKSMPNWKPGTQRNVPVNVKYTLPIVLKLN